MRVPPREGAPGHPRWASWLVLPTYALAAVLLFAPPLARFGDAIPSNRPAFDPALQAFLVGWDTRALLHPGTDPFDLPIFHPEPRVLTYMDSMLGEALVATPVIAWTGSIPAGYNFVFLLGTILSAWGTYRLVRLLRVPRAGAWLCGFLFAFGPYRYANLNFLNQLQTQFLPVGLFFAVRYAERGRTRDAAGAAAATVAQVYFGWYYAFYLAVALGLFGIYVGMGRLARPRPGQLRRLAVLGLVATVLVMPVAWPYLAERVGMHDFRRTLGQTSLYSADVFDYVRWSAGSVVARLLALPRGIAASYWPGLVTLLLGGIGTVAVWERVRSFRRDARRGGSIRRTWRARAEHLRAGVASAGVEGYFVLLAAASFVLSLGPILHFAGRRIWIPLPYAALYYVIPGFSSMRAPARFAALMLLAAVVLAGLGYRHAKSRWGARRPRAWGVAVATLIVVAIGAAWRAPLSILPLPNASTMPEVYRWLAKEPDSAPILELPVPATDRDEGERDTLPQYCLLFHGKPRLDGSSGFISPAYRRFRSVVQSFPSDSSLEAIEAFGGRLIIIHYGEYDATTAAAIATRIGASLRLAERARFGPDVVYAMRRPDPRLHDQPGTPSARSGDTTPDLGGTGP